MKYKARDQYEILNELLANITEDYLKVPGTFMHDFNKSSAIELEKIDKKIEKIWNLFEVENLSGYELEQRVNQLKGVKRKLATHAVGLLKITGTCSLRAGDIFETKSGTQFVVVKDTGIQNEGFAEIKSRVAGVAGNVGANTIKQMPITIQGVKSVTNPEQTHDGFEAESDESLIERYYLAVRTPATSGNIYHYMQWAREVPGVSDVDVIPLWNGNNTVKVIIINMEKQMASEELVKRVQDYIDPGITGSGAGVAPIGAYCTVVSAKAKPINCKFKIIKGNDYTESLVPQLKESLVSFFKRIAFKKDYVPYALLSSAILEVEGVREWSNLTINSGVSNISIARDEVAILGEVDIDEEFER